MNCTDARRVWNNPQGPIAGLKEVFPEAWDRIHRIAHDFADGKTNPFNDLVQADMRGSGVDVSFCAHHAEDSDPVAEQVHSIVGDAAMGVVVSKFLSEHCGTPMVFGNFCCSSCTAYAPGTSDEDLLALQRSSLKFG